MLLLGCSDQMNQFEDLIIGDKENEISQKYTNQLADFGKRAVTLLESLTIGYDGDYLTGIQMSYLVLKDSRTADMFRNGEGTFNIVEVEDPARIRSK